MRRVCLDEPDGHDDKSEQTPDKIKLAISETQRVMGYASCSFMFGSPGESAITIQETVDLCKDIPHVPEVIFFTTAYPGTSFWKLALDKGLIKNEYQNLILYGLHIHCRKV